MLSKITPLIFISFLIVGNCALPTDFTNSLVASSTGSQGDKSEKGHPHDVDLTKPQIYQMQVKSDISNRFAHTMIISRVRNYADKAQEATFSVVLPESAFISGFIMEVDGRNYTAFVKEKEEAKKTYDRAVASGWGAAHISVSARDSNRFTVSVNIEPESKAAFYLNYEELLKRQDGHYELVINLHPGQPVQDLSVEVMIAESRKITDLKAPPIRSGNEIGNENAELDPRANIELINDTSAIIRFSPNLERQKQLAHILGTKEDKGLAGQFIVQYDVERDPHGGEVLIQDGYFVHFFAPAELTPLPKHVVFVLDTSSSMAGQKIEQLKQAMHKILEQLNTHDLFHIVEFNANVKVDDLNNSTANVHVRQNYYTQEQDSKHDLQSIPFPKACLANADNIQKGKSFVSNLHALSTTNIYDALKIGLHLVEITKEENTDYKNYQPIVMFLTDGEPTTGITSTERIVTEITEYNTGSRKAPIFALSFGDGADKNFLQKLALHNSGFSKHIYEAADASLQLQNFYKQISSPLLSNVIFTFPSSFKDLTKTQFPIHFKGAEIVVAGRSEQENLVPDVTAQSGAGSITFKPTLQQSISNIERLWAYLTVKQLLEKSEISDMDKLALKKKALDLALKYSFVTPVTSLVVVKPHATSAVDTEDAGKSQRPGGVPLSYGRSYFASAPALPGPPMPTAFNFAPMPPVHYPSFGSSRNFIRTGVNRRIYSDSPLQDRIAGSAPTYSFTTVTVSTTVSPTTITTKTSDLFTILPWLRQIVDQNGSLNLPIGNYKLGLNETISDNIYCHRTPLNSAGHCSLIHKCPQIHSHLTDMVVLVQHFCTLRNEYAGICCPSS